MAVLHLSTDEVRELALALQVRLHSVRVELTATDHKDYRTLLRGRLERLEAIAARLDAEASADHAGHPGHP